jgi:topoisomerase IV subunit A
VPSYDGRNKEPVTLPCKLPLLLMLGTEGIAVGMARAFCRTIFPNCSRRRSPFSKSSRSRCLPDFQTGGLMDAREYRDGAGRSRCAPKSRSRTKRPSSSRRFRPTTTTETLIASIEDASRKGKIKVKSINDFTAGEPEIEVRAPSGVSAEQLVDALYAFTDCEVTIASRIMVIKDNRPVEMTVSEVLRENTEQLVATLKRELELKEQQAGAGTAFQNARPHFCREAHLQGIEQARTNEAVIAAVQEGFKPVPPANAPRPDGRTSKCCWPSIRRISLFDINKHREEMEKVKADLEETRQHLKNVTKYAIAHLEALLEKYGPLYPRLTKSSRYDEVDAREVAFKSFKVAYDRESGYVGHKVSGEEFKCDCTKFDKLLMVFKDGHYKVIELPEKCLSGRTWFMRRCRSGTGSSRRPTPIAMRRI